MDRNADRWFVRPCRGKCHLSFGLLNLRLISALQVLKKQLADATASRDGAVSKLEAAAAQNGVTHLGRDVGAAEGSGAMEAGSDELHAVVSRLQAEVEDLRQAAECGRAAEERCRGMEAELAAVSAALNGAKQELSTARSEVATNTTATMELSRVQTELERAQCELSAARTEARAAPERRKADAEDESEAERLRAQLAELQSKMDQRLQMDEPSQMIVNHQQARHGDSLGGDDLASGLRHELEAARDGLAVSAAALQQAEERLARQQDDLDRVNLQAKESAAKIAAQEAELRAARNLAEEVRHLRRGEEL